MQQLHCLAVCYSWKMGYIQLFGVLIIHYASSLNSNVKTTHSVPKNGTRLPVSQLSWMLMFRIFWTNSFMYWKIISAPNLVLSQPHLSLRISHYQGSAELVLLYHQCFGIQSNQCTQKIDWYPKSDHFESPQRLSYFLQNLNFQYACEKVSLYLENQEHWDVSVGKCKTSVCIEFKFESTIFNGLRCSIR